RAGDWCVAYIPSSRFYAIGKVIQPRKQPTCTDNIARTLRDERHLHFSGIVRYTDSQDAFYEDFTDEWTVQSNNYRCHACRGNPGQLESWKYPQRIAVEGWECLRTSGVKVKGLKSLRLAAFQITKPFFDDVRTALCGR